MKKEAQLEEYKFMEKVMAEFGYNVASVVWHMSFVDSVALVY